LPVVPRDSKALLGELFALAGSESTPPTESETTLLVAVWDRAAAHGFGLSFGDDSSLVVVGTDRPPQRVNRKTTSHVGPWDRSSFDPGRAHELTFWARRGELAVAFTDGIDECHYREPETSVQPEHLQGLLVDSEGDAERFVRKLTELARGGVAGHPGSEDHIALVATRALAGAAVPGRGSGPRDSRGPTGDPEWRFGSGFRAAGVPRAC
jgi:hypothetical protein